MHNLRGLALAAILGVALPAALVAQAPAKRLVVIDAGHGGVDPGARGPAGTLEKDVTLRVARELESLLRMDPTIEVRLTRETDTLIPLADRPRLANLWRDEEGSARPALFLSIHANAHQQRGVRGLETYFLSEALTEDARRVAALENSAQRFEDPRPVDDSLGFILNDLRQNHYLRESSDGAALIQRRLRTVNPGPDRGVKQAGFVVLEGAFMPAVLVELGFITNPTEERTLASAAFQVQAARQLAAAISEFFDRPVADGIAATP